MSIFRFYVLCEIRDNSFHIVGYFSKVKQYILSRKNPLTTYLASSSSPSISAKGWENCWLTSATNSASWMARWDHLKNLYPTWAAVPTSTTGLKRSSSCWYKIPKNMPISTKYPSKPAFTCKTSIGLWIAMIWLYRRLKRCSCAQYLRCFSRFTRSAASLFPKSTRRISITCRGGIVVRWRIRRQPVNPVQNIAIQRSSDQTIESLT